MTAIRLTIERIEHGGTVRKTIHQDFKDVPAGMTVERCVRYMLQTAADKFLDKPKERARD